jgi:hypothetical protein
VKGWVHSERDACIFPDSGRALESQLTERAIVRADASHPLQQSLAVVSTWLHSNFWKDIHFPPLQNFIQISRTKSRNNGISQDISNPRSTNSNTQHSKIHRESINNGSSISVNRFNNQKFRICGKDVTTSIQHSFHSPRYALFTHFVKSLKN